MPPKCPVCDGDTRYVDVPRFILFSCLVCGQVLQQVGDGTFLPISDLLTKIKLGDDRARAALSQPHVATVKSFLDIYDQAEQTYALAMAQAKGGLRSVLVQIENRIDAAIQSFTGMDLASDRAAEGLRALREARELVSTLPSRNRGVPQESHGDAAPE